MASVTSLLKYLVMLLAVGMAGLFVGWLVGASREPVVAGLIALIPTSLGAVGLAFLDRRSVRKDMTDDLLEAAKLHGLDPGATEKLNKSLSEHKDPSWRNLLFLAAAVLVFIGLCWGGIFMGIRFRVPIYPPLEKLIEGSKPTAKESATLHELRWHLQSNHVRLAEVEALFNTSIKPILSWPCMCGRCNEGAACDCSENRLAHLRDVVDRVKGYKVNPSAIPAVHGQACSVKPDTKPAPLPNVPDPPISKCFGSA